MHIRWRGMELPSAVQCERETLSAYYGKFVAEPFERDPMSAPEGPSIGRSRLEPLDQATGKDGDAAGPQPASEGRVLPVE